MEFLSELVVVVAYVWQLIGTPYYLAPEADTWALGSAKQVGVPATSLNISLEQKHHFFVKCNL